MDNEKELSKSVLPTCDGETIPVENEESVVKMNEYKFSGSRFFNKDFDIDRISIKVQFGETDEDFKMAFTKKNSCDKHNRKIENALLEYRIKYNPITSKHISIDNLKHILFGDFLSESAIGKISIKDAKISHLKDCLTLCVVSRFMRRFYHGANDFDKAIEEWNFNHQDKKILSFELK